MWTKPLDLVAKTAALPTIIINLDPNGSTNAQNMHCNTSKRANKSVKQIQSHGLIITGRNWKMLVMDNKQLNQPAHHAQTLKLDVNQMSTTARTTTNDAS
jgi:hypothetical protein